MGASAWSARVPYQADLEAALQQARVEAYEGGDFYRTGRDEDALSMSEKDYVATSIAWSKANAPGLFEDEVWELDAEMHSQAWRAARTVITGPDSLIAAQPWSGAHSVIDITGIAAWPEHAKACPVSAEVLEELFQTQRPSTEAVEKAIAGGRIEEFGRWQAVYLIGHVAGAADTIFFVGSSGD